MKKLEPSKLALEVAARCWCDDETREVEMDMRLATAFAKRLDKCIRLIIKGRDAHWLDVPYLEYERLIDDMTAGKI